jgi:hypothetical protein
MRRAPRVFLVATMFILGLVLTSSGQERSGPGWKASAYKGLTPGMSTMPDVIRRLGRPKAKTLAETDNPTELEWHYEQSESDGLCCNVSFKKGIVQSITITLPNVEQSKAIQIFGGRFIKIRFSDDDTRGGGGSSPLCEDPTGDQVMLLDPGRGLFLWVEADGRVSGATFAASRPGAGECRKK